MPTLRNLLVQEPRRLRMLGGKFLALLVYLLLSALLAVGISSAITTLVAPSVGVATAAWWTGDGLTQYVDLLGNLAMAIVGWSIFGAFIAVIVRSAAGAVGASIAWLLVIEGLLAQVWPEVARWLPGSLLNTMIARGNANVSYSAALLVSAIYAVAMLVIGGVSFAFRDVTA